MSRTKTAVLFKDEMIGLIGMRFDGGTAVLIKVDPRKPMPVVVPQDHIGEGSYDQAVRVSVEQGWRVIHNGPPNFG